MKNKAKVRPTASTLSSMPPAPVSMPTAAPSPLRMLSLKEVLRRTGLSRTTIYKLQSEGKFPERVKLTERRSAWPEHEVEAHMQRLLKARAERSKRGAP